MTTRFEFHLTGAAAPQGELQADDLLAIVGSLKEMASKIGRIETDAERLGRTPRRTKRIADLTIGLAPGSTTLHVHRTGVADTLDFDSSEEQAFDEKFAELVEAFARNSRPSWVSDSLGLATADFIGALQQAATSARFTVDGRTRTTFLTASVHRDLWRVPARPGTEDVTFVGRLYSANLNEHRLLVEDAVGNHVRLPRVVDDVAASRLLGETVVVIGTPEYETDGRLKTIRHASITAATDEVGVTTLLSEITIDDILSAAPGPDLEDGIDMEDEEFELFLKAVRE